MCRTRFPHVGVNGARTSLDVWDHTWTWSSRDFPRNSRGTPSALEAVMRIPSIALLLLAGCGDPSSLENFHEVRSGLFRGGHPNTDSFAFLESMGVKTIVDLEIDNGIEADGDDIAQELADAANANITVLRFPMSAFDSPDDEFDRMIDQIMTTLADPSLGPIYVHCAHGQDRTGLVIALERVIDEGWDPRAAHDEMLAFGFHTMFVGLNHYYEEKTGWED
jgi:protein tyrosine/serine phosphatase